MLRGFAKNYFTLSAILAHSVAHKLQSQSTSAQTLFRLSNEKPGQVILQVSGDVASRKTRRQGHARPEVRVEMHVFDPSDVRAPVDVDADFERAGEHVANGVQFVPFRACVDSLVRIGHGDVPDLAQLAVATDGPGIRGHVG